MICLGSGGGPCEDNVTGFLVRSVATNWARNSLLALDAGSHLAPVTRILERDFPLISKRNSPPQTHEQRILNGSSSPASPDDESDDEGAALKSEPTILSSGPFAGLKCPEASARANALNLLRLYISAYLITHPHLDHLSGFAINTAAFHATTRPKTVAALPGTIDAIKRHIFNDVIWPNLTDEDGGVGFVTFQRLKEGGDSMVGEGEGRGYIDVSDGLGVRAFKVSHGVCTKSPPSHQHRGSVAGVADSQQPPYSGSISGAPQDSLGPTANRSHSVSNQFSAPGTPGGSRQSFHATQSPRPQVAEHACVVDSTAFFVRDFETSRELLFFGDVEPDSLSLCPRNHVVWAEAARKIAYGHLGSIFIECSYDDSQADAFLFGHLNPRHLVAELQTLAMLTEEAKHHRQTEEKGAKKRKRSVPNGLILPEHDRKRTRSFVSRTLGPHEQHRGSHGSDKSMSDAPMSATAASTPTTETVPVIHTHHHHHSQPLAQTSAIMVPGEDPRGGPLSPKSVTLPQRRDGPDEMPLLGIKVIIIHVKDTLRDGAHVSEKILSQLLQYERGLQEQGQGLGCEFIVAQSGESYWI